MSASIAIVVPVLARPANVPAFVSSWLSATEAGLTQILFVANYDDQAEVDAIHAIGLHPHLCDWSAGPGDYARKINAAFARTSEPLILLGADDLRFHPGWADAVIAYADEHPEVGVIGTDDLGNPTVRRGAHSTHPVVRRSYIEERGGFFDGEPGKVYFEGYDHQYVDTELVELAKLRGAWGFCAGAVVEHLHPLWRKGEMDDTYRRALAKGAEDAAIFRRRLREYLARIPAGV